MLVTENSTRHVSMMLLLADVMDDFAFYDNIILLHVCH